LSASFGGGQKKKEIGPLLSLVLPALLAVYVSRFSFGGILFLRREKMQSGEFSECKLTP
jgi:hypothetical protein